MPQQNTCKIPVLQSRFTFVPINFIWTRENCFLKAEISMRNSQVTAWLHQLCIHVSLLTIKVNKEQKFTQEFICKPSVYISNIWCVQAKARMKIKSFFFISKQRILLKRAKKMGCTICIYVVYTKKPIKEYWQVSAKKQPQNLIYLQLRLPKMSNTEKFPKSNEVFEPTIRGF